MSTCNDLAYRNHKGLSLLFWEFRNCYIDKSSGLAWMDDILCVASRPKSIYEEVRRISTMQGNVTTQFDHIRNVAWQFPKLTVVCWHGAIQLQATLIVGN